MKKILLFILIASWIIFLLNISYSSSYMCNYSAKIKQCLEEKNKRIIEDFVCIDWTKEEITYQIILDEKFNQIDKLADEYLTQLEKQKDKYFWANAESNYIEADNQIEAKFSINWEYYEKYKKVCWIELIQETMDCNEWNVNFKGSVNYFENSTCMDLAILKLHIYKQVSYDILMLNKLSVRQDSSKEHLQKERIKYDEVIDSMMINSWYMERISKKWPSKLKNTYKN